MCGDYDPEFDSYVQEQVALRTCDHANAWEYMHDWDRNEARYEECFCPNCGKKVTYDSLMPMYSDMYAETRAEIAMEEAAERRLLNICEEY